MADEKKDSLEKDVNTPKSKVTVKEEKFTVEDFMENAEALGYTKVVLAGAFSNCSKDDKFTKTEVEKKVKSFLGKKVK